MTASDICLRADNMGWRYTLFTVGGLVLLMALSRTFLFKIPESPYFLLSHSRDAEAFEAVQYIAKKSNKPCLLTMEHIKEINDRHGLDTEDSAVAKPFLTLFAAQFKQMSFQNLKPLFGKPRLALQTGILVWIWAAVGIAYPLYTWFLPVYLQAKFTAIQPDYSTRAVYSQYCYIAACTVPGPIIASYVIETRLGRRYTMAITTIASGVFLYLSTLANTNHAVVGWNCAATLVINFFFAIQVSVSINNKYISNVVSTNSIQYAYTPESFPSTIRATAMGLLSTIGYVCGLAAPIISSQTGTATNVPIYVSGGLMLVTGVIMCGLPIETARQHRL
jgi:hypothetical protein